MEPVIEQSQDVVQAVEEVIVSTELPKEAVNIVSHDIQIVSQSDNVEQVQEVVHAVEEAVVVAELPKVEQVQEVVHAVEEAVVVAELPKVEQVQEVVHAVEEAVVVAELPKVEQVQEVVHAVDQLKLSIEIPKEETGVVEQVIELSEVVVKAVDEANSLTGVQKEALEIVFHDVQSTIETILAHPDLSLQIKIMQMISPIITTVQDVSSLKLALTGADKKAIALECGRKCIKMMGKDHLDILMLYNTIAEPALETMLDLTRKLKPVQEQLKELEKQPTPEGCLALFAACLSVKSK